MAAKTKPSNPLNGMHTAGIFSDMSIDGPEIGTLVLIIDRAKNLPNRKTIGKQDPYCAARLAKEAKKTTTDIRGGQTPKWDQELRFLVHDSPDYYQLKLSVFNDDRKTELIGETWIDLRDIVVRGGGQSDQWHNLNCKGKYAGEVRIEITYYDSRPKLEKPVAKPSSVTPGTDAEAGGSQKPAVKRRPLPSDPVTGQAPSPAVSDQVHTPARPQPNPPASLVPSQSAPPAVEYNTPPSHRPSTQPDQYSQAHPSVSQYSTPSHRPDYSQPRVLDRNYQFPPHENQHLRHSDSPYSRSYEPDPRSLSHSYSQPNFETPPPPVHHHRQSIEHDERPPPPPAHRVRNSSGTSHELVPRGNFDMLQHKATPPMRHDVLRSEAHRYSVPSPSSSYPGRPTYRPFDSAPEVQGTAQYHESETSLELAPRHYSYDSAYDSHHRSLQPTVEDVPESWTPPTARTRAGGSRAAQYDEREYHQASSPAPLNLGGRGSAASGHYNPTPVQSQQQYDPNGYSPSHSPMASEDYSQALTLVSRPSWPRQRDYAMDHPSELEDNQLQAPGDYDPPSVPPTLVPGVDPALAREISDRFHQERKQARRYTQPPPMNTPPRGRQQSEPPSNYVAHYSPNGNPPSSSRGYDRSPVTYSGGPTTPSGQISSSGIRGVSPTPSHHTIKRKSVSPAPPPSSDGRRLSGVPFGPDSYEALNPSISSQDLSKSSEYTNAEGKIVTPDGREIDPSDHLPMDTWAPEPEPKKPTESAETRPRPVPVGAQPMPPSNRRPPRGASRPIAAIMPPPTYGASDPAVSPPVSTGRNRLQKKQHRQSALPAPISSGSSPLGPSTPHQRNSTPPRALVRAGTFDYENHGPGAARTGYGTAPPIPAKIPMMSGGLGPSPSRGGEEWALMEEMSRIDIGTGRARRHGRY
ncbi:U3 small nucleolar RNA-associated protein 15 [Hypoxylon texense]